VQRSWWWLLGNGRHWFDHGVVIGIRWLGLGESCGRNRKDESGEECDAHKSAHEQSS
jgi:hypothetical protein